MGSHTPTRSFCCGAHKLRAVWRFLRAALRFGACLLSPSGAPAEEAFDLAAETFAAALASVPRFQPGPEPAQAWLFAIARHKLSEALRSSRIQDEARRALAMQPIRLDDEAIEILETTARAPALELLEALTVEQREAIEAHHLEERGYAEIAADLRCSESVVRKRVSRGLALLHAQLRKGEAS